MENSTYTSGEVAQMCGVSKTTVVRWIREGRIAAYLTPGGHRRVPAIALHTFMKAYGMPIPKEIRSAALRSKVN
ncbi:MAG: helix-turn-helix domain-containing protein [Planctomycetota bacterium]